MKNKNEKIILKEGPPLGFIPKRKKNDKIMLRGKINFNRYFPYVETPKDEDKVPFWCKRCKIITKKQHFTEEGECKSK